MGLHCLDYCLIRTEFLENPPSNFYVSALNLMVESLPYVVDEGSGLCNLHVCTKLLGNHSSDVGHLNRVLENVLAV